MRTLYDRTCYCHTCKRAYHCVGIARHRAMHRDRGENCTISYTYGNTVTYNYQRKREGEGHGQ